MNNVFLKRNKLNYLINYFIYFIHFEGGTNNFSGGFLNFYRKKDLVDLNLQYLEGKKKIKSMWKFQGKDLSCLERNVFFLKKKHLPVFSSFFFINLFNKNYNFLKNKYNFNNIKIILIDLFNSSFLEIFIKNNILSDLNKFFKAIIYDE